MGELYEEPGHGVDGRGVGDIQILYGENHWMPHRDEEELGYVAL